MLTALTSQSEMNKSEKTMLLSLLQKFIQGKSDPHELLIGLNMIEKNSINNFSSQELINQISVIIEQFRIAYLNEARLGQSGSVSKVVQYEITTWPKNWGAVGDYFFVPPLAPDATPEQQEKHEKLLQLRKKEQLRGKELRVELGKEGLAKLYEGTDEKTVIGSTVAREAFLSYLARRKEAMAALPADKTNTKEISMEELLGEVGIQKYMAALTEETNSQAFRNAVMLQSTRHYEGKQWEEPKVIIGAGATGSGKSHARDQVVASISEEKDKGHPGNDVVSVDGGIEREVSQIRMLTLQVALSKGYNGIDDLQKVSEKIDIKIKSKIQKAVIAANEAKESQYQKTLTQHQKDPSKPMPPKPKKFSLYVPVTFANPKDSIKLLKSFSVIKALMRNPGFKPLFIFVNTNPTQIEYLGKNRAWRKGELAYPENDIRLGSVIDKVEPGCESKAHKPGNIERGNSNSQDALKEAKKEGIECKIVDNDLVHLKSTIINSEKYWVICTDPKKNDDEIKLSRRDFERWQKLCENQHFKANNPLEEWIKNPANRSALTIIDYDGQRSIEEHIKSSKPLAKRHVDIQDSPKPMPRNQSSSLPPLVPQRLTPRNISAPLPSTPRHVSGTSSMPPSRPPPAPPVPARTGRPELELSEKGKALSHGSAESLRARQNQIAKEIAALKSKKDEDRDDDKSPHGIK